MLDFFWKGDFSNDDVEEFKPLISKHLIQELLHSSSVCRTLDIVHFEMGLSSNQYSNSFSDSSLKLFVKLVDTDSVAEIENVLFSWFASENDGDTETNENVVVSWASSYLEGVSHVLLCNKELDFGPWEAEMQATLTMYAIEFTMFCDNSICSFRSIKKMNKFF